MKKAAIIPVFFLSILHSQDFSDLRHRYDHFEDNDKRAFEYINPYIKKAKKERNNRELTQAYKDAVSFSPEHKLTYADSLIMAASLTEDRDLLAAAYLTKGTVYYFTYRKFQPALDEYLKAWAFAHTSEDKYLYHKNLYHIGVVKHYLGYYGEALPIFERCITFFNRDADLAEHPNLKLNRQKGYLNSLHMAALCLISLSRLEEAQVLTEKGFALSRTDSGLYLERCRFYKLKGIIAFSRGQHSTAVQQLSNAIPGLVKKNDFTDASLVWYYRGKSLWNTGKKAEAVKDFVKVDSVFHRYKFILPAVRESYDLLIKYSHDSGDRSMELYYTKQLLNADRALESDFKYLSGRIHRDFDTPEMLAARRKFDLSLALGSVFTSGLLAAIAVLCIIIIYWRRKYESALQGKYDLLVLNNKPQNDERQLLRKGYAQFRDKITENKSAELLAKLDLLEGELFFCEKGLTLKKLADTLKTNTSYLSAVINTHKGCSFKVYLNKMRIRYIRDMLYEQRTWRRYSVEVLARECGYADRSKFSKAFKRENGVSPVEFVRKREEELSGV